MAKKALLMILDGWGIGKHDKGDVIYNTPTPELDYLNANYPIRSFWHAAKTLDFPMVKWETPR